MIKNATVVQGTRTCAGKDRACAMRASVKGKCMFLSSVDIKGVIRATPDEVLRKSVRGEKNIVI